MSTSKDNMEMEIEDLEWILSDVQNILIVDCQKLIDKIYHNYNDGFNAHKEIERWVRNLVKKSKKKIINRDIQWDKENELDSMLINGEIKLPEAFKKREALEKKYQMHKNFDC